MKFIDEAIIEVIAGDGGKGCASFRREKYVPMGGPDGGDGGRGGHVIFQTATGLTTLMDVRYRRRFKADSGEHGRGKQQYGKGGADYIVKIPVGTMVYDAATDELLFDFDRHPLEWIAARGGHGGRGNMHFKSSTNQAPRRAEPGGEGEERKIRLELKLLADVGLIGLPNAGKSTLIAAISNVRPKIADYPFTTTTPNLGVVQLTEDQSCVVADIPGLIEGANHGAGMGIQFLRHIERTRLLVHLIDVADPAHPDPLKNYMVLRSELAAYDAKLLERPEIVCLTKMDLPEAREKADEIVRALKKKCTSVLAISAATREGLAGLLKAIAQAL